MSRTPTNGAQLLEMAVADVHALFERRGLLPSELVGLSLRRVAELDLDTDKGVPFNAVLTIDPRVGEQAVKSDRELTKSGIAAPLHGIPVWIKDHIDVQGLPTMCGCLALEHNVVDRDAELVANLRRAGAIIMGKVGMTELGMGTSAYSTASVRIGNAFEPRNPPGGSSNGSAVAVSLGFGALAVGVDDCESIAGPAALNGCVGLRPTVGLVPRAGLWSYSESDTSPGPMGRTVQDVATMLDVLVGKRARPDGSELRALRSDVLRGRRIGVLEAINGHEVGGEGPSGASQALADAVKKLRACGAEIVERVRIEDIRTARLSSLEYYNSMLRALRRSTGAPCTFRALCRSPVVAPFVKKTLDSFWTKHGPSIALPNFLAGRYQAAIRHNQALLGASLEKDRLDCLVAITSGTLSDLSTVAQAPHLTVPAGFCRATAKDADFVLGSLLPVGLSFIGRPFADRTLLELGFAFEHATCFRTQPRPEAEGLTRAGLELDIDHFNALKRHIAHGAHRLLELGAGPSGEAFRIAAARLKANFGGPRGISTPDC